MSDPHTILSPAVLQSAADDAMRAMWFVAFLAACWAGAAMLALAVAS